MYYPHMYTMLPWKWDAMTLWYWRQVTEQTEEWKATAFYFAAHNKSVEEIQSQTKASGFYQKLQTDSKSS